MGKRANETAEEREKRLAYNREWNALHRDNEKKKRKDRYYMWQQDVQINEYRIKRLEVLERMGAKCVVCGVTDESILTVDHVMDDGAAERKNNNRNIYHILHNMIDIPIDRYQILCSPCNHKKRIFGPNPDKWPTRTVGEQLAYLKLQIKTMEQSRIDHQNKIGLTTNGETI